MARSILVSDAELPELQKFYQQELEKAEQRVQEIRNTLQKLGVDQAKASTPAAKDSLPPAGETAASGKTTRKKKSKKTQQRPRWGEFILEYLRSQDQLMRVGSIIREAFDQFDIAPDEQKSVEQAIYNGLNRLQKVNGEVIGYVVPNKKGRYYGLKDWFSVDGTPKEEFVNKVED
jgi:hypothetical protein